MVQVHTDQRNDPREDGTERLLAVLRRDGALVGDDLGGPMVWAVHMISPSAYEDARWDRLVEALLEFNVGVIVAPSAALGMRQLRSQMAPTHNSIARVLELAAAGVPVRLGSDNVCDMLSPSSTLDMMSEVYCLSAALRFYQQDILAKLATGTSLTTSDRALIQEHLDKDAAEIARITSHYS
jgi:cytosine deaminase